MTRKIIVVLAFVTVMSAFLATAVFAGGSICGVRTDSFPAGDKMTRFFVQPGFDLFLTEPGIVRGFSPGIAIGPNGEVFVSFLELLRDPSAPPASRLKLSFSQSLPNDPSFFSLWFGTTESPPPLTFSLKCEGSGCPPGGSSLFNLSPPPGGCPNLQAIDP